MVEARNVAKSHPGRRFVSRSSIGAVEIAIRVQESRILSHAFGNMEDASSISVRMSSDRAYLDIRSLSNLMIGQKYLKGAKLRMSGDGVLKPQWILSRVFCLRNIYPTLSAVKLLFRNYSNQTNLHVEH